jgi:hypothetical protein
MSPQVHILATVRNPALLDAALLVFKTLRRGFPTFKVCVYPNILDGGPEVEAAIQQAALDTDCEVRYVTDDGDPDLWTHSDWIRHVITQNTNVQIICDTDVVFYESVEGWPMRGDMMGWRIPQFRCPYTRSTTLSRLHTALLWMNCDSLQRVLNFENKTYLATEDLIAPCVFWSQREKMFHDTLGQMANHEQVATSDFEDWQLDAFAHLFSGTIVDLVGPKVAGLNLAHHNAYKNPEIMRGAWRGQKAFFASRAL